MRRLSFLFILIGLGAPTGAQEPAPKDRPDYSGPLTRSRCIEEAIARNPEVLAAQAEIQRTEGLIISAKSSVYPTLSTNVRVGFDDDDIFNSRDRDDDEGFDRDWQIDISIAKSVYNGGIDRNRIAAAKLQKEVAFFKYKEAVNDVIAEVQEAYNEALFYRDEIGLREENIRILYQDVKRQQELFDAGRASKLNILRAEVRLTNDLPELDGSRASKRIAEAKLFELMGRDWDVREVNRPVVLAGSLDCPPIHENIQELVAKARALSPELEAQSREVEIEEKNVRIARGQLYPKVDLFAGTRIRALNNQAEYFAGRVESSFGLSVNWMLFDGFESKGEAMIAAARARTEAILRGAVARKTDYSVEKAWLLLEEAQASIRAQSGNVAKAAESMRLAEEGIAIGKTAQFDVLQATVDLRNAQASELRARFRYHQALAQLERVTYARLHIDQ